MYWQISVYRRLIDEVLMTSRKKPLFLVQDVKKMGRGLVL